MATLVREGIKVENNEEKSFIESALSRVVRHSLDIVTKRFS